MPAAAPYSVFLMTIHKAASSFVGAEILPVLAKAQGFEFMDLSVKAFNAGADYRETMEAHRSILESPGYCFGPFRGSLVLNMLDMSANRLLVHVRDPRDCVVSAYYSFGYSHSVPPGEEEQKRFLERRERILSQSIDEFAVDEIGTAVQRIRTYLKHARRADRYLISRYEDMVLDFPAWAQKISAFIGGDDGRAAVDELVSRISFETEAEDIYSHKRQVQPGDHRRKLQPETIDRLNEACEDLLAKLGYGADGEIATDFQSEFLRQDA